MARLLNLHKDINCLVEPFHPRRYNGHFNRMALQESSVESALNLIWHRWNGIKHVWEAPSGWPFVQNSTLNEGIPLSCRQVLILERRNLLRRFVSNAICKQLRFWIGTREEFHARLESVQLLELNATEVLQGMKADKASVAKRVKFVQKHGIPMMHLFYEDIFSEDVTADAQLKILNNVLAFLGYNEIDDNEFRETWFALLDNKSNQWASSDVYRMIPGIDRLESEVGSDEMGWLF
jgi:hypothetical protein